MASSHGKFVWYELMTTETKAAEDFYTKVTGLVAYDPNMPGMPYTMLRAGDTTIGGIARLPDEAIPPHWVGYIYVDNVDSTANLIVTAGGTIRRPPDDIPEVGRFAVVADPQGATFIIFKPDPEPANPPPRPAPGAPGAIGWHELMAEDWQTAFAFYSTLFGWTKAEAHEMGPMGTYQTFATGEFPVGGMMNMPSQMPRSAWQYYINVADIDAAAANVTSGGGKIMHGPVQVPGGSWILNGQDPQGAHFSLVGPRA